MNKNAIKKLMIAAIACIALCCTTLAAPRVVYFAKLSGTN